MRWYNQKRWTVHLYLPNFDSAVSAFLCAGAAAMLKRVIEYFSHSSIHGLHYIIDPKRHISERQVLSNQNLISKN